MKCPIKTVDLPGVPNLDMQGLIVVIGPNSSGKTQFLHDLNETICGRFRQGVLASEIKFQIPASLEESFQYFCDQRAIIQNQGDPSEFRHHSLQIGSDFDGGGRNIAKQTFDSYYSQFVNAVNDKSVKAHQLSFVTSFGLLFCSALFLDKRLDLMNEASLFDTLQQSPSTTLQALHVNKDAKETLRSEISRVFRRGVWVDNNRNKLLLLVSDKSQIPTADERLEPEEMVKYRTIRDEGDGLRSYVAICTTLLLGQRPLCLIDEPEMCLHPPQAQAMGRFIGEHASDENCTVVSTHNSHVLRGILETKLNTRVIRLTNVNSTFHANTLTPDDLNRVTSKPRSRSETILDGLLSNAVVLCESEGDRLVYESTYRTFKDPALDIRFIPSEGTGGFAEPLRLYKSLNVPSAVITDFDFLAKDGELRKVLAELGLTGDRIKDICSRISKVVRRIKSFVSDTDIRAEMEEINNLVQSELDPNENGYSSIRGKLNELTKKLNSLGEVKQQGLNAISGFVDSDNSSGISLHDEVEAILAELRGIGLFIVPVGELESWLPILMKGQSRQVKGQWAMLAAEKIEDVGVRNDDVWEFVQKVYKFLELEEQALSNTTPKTAP